MVPYENLNGYQTVHMNAGAKDGTLKEKRLVLEMTQQEVAEKARISLSSYQKFETGDRNIRTASFEVTCRVVMALGMDPTAFYKGEYVFGEPTIFDKDGQKYVRTGRLVNEDIDENEAVNAMRIHIHRDGIFVPMKILRAMDCPEVVQLLYHEQDKRFGIRILKKKEENSLEVPGDVYSGKWRGIQITDRDFIDTVYRIIGKTDEYVGEPVFFEKGCVLALDEVTVSDYMVDAEKFMKVL